jgi:hypothetical protein
MTEKKEETFKEHISYAAITHIFLIVFFIHVSIFIIPNGQDTRTEASNCKKLGLRKNVQFHHNQKRNFYL